MAASAVNVELDEIQGLLLRGHGELTEARFLLLKVTDAALARAYLGELAKRINYGNRSPDDVALHVAFTRPGLEALDVRDYVVGSFSREFIEGMDHELRAPVLGDRDKNHPDAWEWSQKKQPIHALLMIYATKEAFDRVLAEERRLLRAGGLEILDEKETRALGGDIEEHQDKEHFGWKDGLSMPKFLGVDKTRIAKPARKRGAPEKKREWWTKALPAGEFILGYPNDYSGDDGDTYENFTESPFVEPEHDPANHLRVGRDKRRKDLGRNGTYLVYREMTQDVFEFWKYLADNSREGEGDRADKAIALGAKMVGRWPSGAPLITKQNEFQAHDDPGRAFHNEFRYGKDLEGTMCPHGAHIRRASPRDVLALDDRDEKAAVSMVQKHQMIRRGRPFGAPVTEDMDPRKIMQAAPDKVRRGLHFICLVGDINRQFEFVQRAWIDSANFDAMCRDGDPIAAARRHAPDVNYNDEFTCPAVPVRRRYKKMPQFTTLVGGAYFFLPSRAALRYIAQVPR